MEGTVEKGCSALGGLFQSIVNDLKAGMPIWEDFLAKAAKLHSHLKATILATTAFLDAFQKIADLATNTKGATKDIGTALTRIILRHKAVEARMKTFTSSIMDCLVLPLQDKMEEWKKSITQLDKDHAKEYKKARQEIKKRSSDTLRLQKKVRKGKCDIQRSLDHAMQDVNDKFLLLEETEKHAVRTALVEERSHFCLLVACLKPVVDEEIAMLGEITHLQEILDQLLKNTSDPFTLPPASEQIINDIKTSDSNWSFQTPPSSPSSLGSRKSSVCSISSLNSSSSGSTKSHSPSHHFRYRVHSQQPIPVGTVRLSSVSSQDSGFTSQDTLFLRPPTPPPLELARQVSNTIEAGNSSTGTSSTASTPSSPYPVGPSTTATWPNLQETLHFDKAATAALMMAERPHTISTAYEKGHQRPALTVHTFEPPDRIHLQDGRVVSSVPNSPQINDPALTPTPTGIYEDVPPLPDRYVQVERPVVPEKSGKFSSGCQTPCKDLPDFNQPGPNQVVPQPLYINMDELGMPERKTSNTLDHLHKQLPQQAELTAALTRELQQRRGHSSDSEGNISHSSLLSSSGYGSQGTVATASDDRLVTEGNTTDISDQCGTLISTSPSEDLVENVEEDFVYDSTSMDEASKYCTIPRYTDHSHILAQVIAKRPASTTGFPPGTHSSGHIPGRSSTLRRSSSQTHKPPLPIRRTSSITSQHGLSVAVLRSQAGAATLPRAASCSDGSRSQLRQLSDDSLDHAFDRKCSLDSQNLTLTRKGSLQNHTPHSGSSSRKASLDSHDLTSSRRIEAEEYTTFRKASLDDSVNQTVQELDNEVTPKTTTSILQEHITAKLNSMVNQDHLSQEKTNIDGKINASSGSDHNSLKRNGTSSQGSQIDGEPFPPPFPDQLRTGSHPGSPKVRSPRTNSPCATSHHSGNAQIGSPHSSSPRTNSPRMGSLARRMSEPGRYQVIEENVVINRANLIQSLNAKLFEKVQQSSPSPPPTLPKPSQQASQECSQQHEAFLQSLNAKLAQQVQKQSTQQPPPSQKNTTPPALSHKQSFKESLNAKLAQQHSAAETGSSQRLMARRASAGDAATRLRQWMGSRAPADPVSCRESLMDQIRRGASLRKTYTNDRSAPRIQ